MFMDTRKTQGIGAAMFAGMALSGLLATAFIGGTAMPARADASAGDTLDLSDLERVTDDSLGVLRGGFRVGDVDLSFGVTMSTSVNGQQVLQTVFNPGDGPNSTSANGWNGAPGANGFQVTSPDQKTTISHELGQSITTNIANSGDNRVISNSTTVDLFLNNLSQVQAQASASRMSSNTLNDLNNHFVMGN